MTCASVAEAPVYRGGIVRYAFVLTAENAPACWNRIVGASLLLLFTEW